MNSKEVIKILKQNGFDGEDFMRYFAKFKKEKEGGYSVSFPLLKGCLSEGDSYEEAKAMATEALSLWLESALEYNEAIPAPREYFGEEYVAIEVPACLEEAANATGKIQAISSAPLR